MPTTCILQSGSTIRLSGERLVVTTPETESSTGDSREIPIRDVDRLVHSEYVHLTSPALSALLAAEIPVSILAGDGRFLGSFLPPLNTQAQARLLQYQRTLDPIFAREISTRLVHAKLYNQRRVLQRLLSNREVAAPEIAAALGWLDASFSSIHLSSSIDELRGHEGSTTARYFSAWSNFLPPEFPFERRSTRPPLNAVNACISFAATILYTEMVAHLHAHGLDPALGCLHVPTDGRWSLALDLVEPFRPAFVEALALDLFSHQILNASHFESRDGGVYLNDAGRRKFFLQYERRLERQFLSESAGHRTTLRQQMERQTLLFKAALNDPKAFKPFQMN